MQVQLKRINDQVIVVTGFARRSLYTTAAMHPVAAGAVAIGVTLLLGTWLRSGSDVGSGHSQSH